MIDLSPGFHFRRGGDAILHSQCNVIAAAPLGVERFAEGRLRAETAVL
jgi:hypothetical protein